MEFEHLRFPVGRYKLPEHFTETFKNECIDSIAGVPEKIKQVISGFSEKQWHTPYREGGWNAVQVVHHMADSHLNAYCRFKLGMTEETPIIKSYEEKEWAKTADANVVPPTSSILLIEGLHERWVTFLKSLTMDDYMRTILRTETNTTQNLQFLLGLYAWHGNHHLGHLELIRKS